jgi:hypothetical protein
VAVVLPPDLTTKLAAVNVLLSTIAESPVSSLDVSLSVDVATAIGAIDEVDRAFQTKGWHWNREDSLTLSPDGSGEIALPENYLWVGSAYWLDSSSPVRVTERGRKLYNRDDHSYVFSQPVALDLVVKLEWEEMPEYARQYITIAAAEIFQARTQGTSIVERVTRTDVEAKMALCEQREDEAEENNNIGGNRYVQSTLGNRVRRRY